MRASEADPGNSPMAFQVPRVPTAIAFASCPRTLPPATAPPSRHLSRLPAASCPGYRIRHSVSAYLIAPAVEIPNCRGSMGRRAGKRAGSSFAFHRSIMARTPPTSVNSWRRTNTPRGVHDAFDKSETAAAYQRAGIFRLIPRLFLRLNHFDAHAIGRGDIAQHQAGFEFPRLHRHAHALFLQLRAECPQVPAIGETEVVGPPLVVTGVPVEMLHGFGGDRRFPRPMAADNQRDAADAHVDLRRAAQVRLFRGNLAPEHFLVPVRGRPRAATVQMEGVECKRRVHPASLP